MTADPRAVEIAARALEDVQPPESDPTPPDEAFFADARRVLAALSAAGWSLLPPGGHSEDLFVVIKSVPGREPEIMADMATDPGELNHWLAALREDPNGDRLATYTGYRLAPADTPGEPA